MLITQLFVPVFSTPVQANTQCERITLRASLSRSGSDEIVVTCETGSGIRKDTGLFVKEITQSDGACDVVTDYERLLASAAATLGCDPADIAYARFFDITLMSAEKRILQPEQAVRVELCLESMSAYSNIQVIHFAEDATEIVASEKDEASVQFAASGFSVYAVVAAPESRPYATGWQKVTSIDEFFERGADGIRIRHADGYYFTNRLWTISSNRTGIEKTARQTNTDNVAGAATYYVEQLSEDSFRVWCRSSQDVIQYVAQVGNSLKFVSEDQASVFHISMSGTDTFRVLGSNGYYWNMQGGSTGKCFAAWQSADDVNARIQFEYYAGIPFDPYGLDGQSFGVVYDSAGNFGAALTPTGFLNNNGLQRLSAVEVTIRPDVLDSSYMLFVADDVPMWTFHAVDDGYYQISIVTDGGTKYLAIRDTEAYLVSEPDEHCLLTLQIGQGDKTGCYQIVSNSHRLGLIGNVLEYGFGGIATNGANTYLYFVKPSEEVGDDDFNLYTARKISVSDVSLTTGSQVVVYSRVWNPTTLTYEFYALGHDGRLIRCYESGDLIQWVGSRINETAWLFTEYTYADGTPNYYYELQNLYSGMYLAPQIKDGQALSDHTIGVNLNGRRYEDNYTTILAWDDPYYQYAGLKIENGKLVSCPMSEAGDFYFAILEQPVTATLTQVETVDNSDYGIVMKMVDFNNSIAKERDSGQTAVFGYDTNAAGIVQNQLDANGYPVTDASVTGKPSVSLQGLFGDAVEVNHLFIQSILNESGYFEFDSTQNFAWLNGSDFEVYDQLATVYRNGSSSYKSMYHGQFMPYNSLINPVTGQTWSYSELYTYLTTTMNEPVSDSNPRKGERLIEIPQGKADYFFGMQIEASFTQTVSGLDAWGNDMIFEFSGDDDMWFFVDDELVLDLGGVHSAMSGTINFRTGQITRSKRTGEQSGVSTTLRTVFGANYMARNPGASITERDAWLDTIFDGEVFRDYTPHKMQVFYMERGAGGSNLHMRFNLMSVKPGTVLLEKEISGSDKQDYLFAEFGFQVYYQTEVGGTVHLLGEDDEIVEVYYHDTHTPVKWLDHWTPSGMSVGYDDVLFIEPGQKVEIAMPDNAISYYVQECGINSHIYDAVSVNGDAMVGVSVSGESDRLDYPVAFASVEERPVVVYNNHVSANALRTLTVTKRLYDEDGTTLLSKEDDPTEFSLRLYFGSDSADVLRPAYFYPYHVRDGQGHYCTWDVASQTFSATSFTDLTGLSDAVLETLTFMTSPNGAVSKIPAGFSVEVQDLLVGTRFRVEERLNEIPKGYVLRSEDGYTRIGGSFIAGEAENEGIVRDNSDPVIEVRNQRGWSLSVEKLWSDAGFVSDHDVIFMAVYLQDETGLTLLPNSVIALESGDTGFCWYFSSLETGYTFNDYRLREVIVERPDSIVDADGYLLDPGTVTPVEDGEELLLHADGVEYPYHVFYTMGEVTGGNQNVRLDTVLNLRAGLKLVKTDWDGNPIAGARFHIETTSGTVVSPLYVSDATGLIGMAYLDNGSYVLVEEAPADGCLLPSGTECIPFTVSDGTVTLGETEASCALTVEQGVPVISVQNQRFTLKAMKIDQNGNQVSLVHFALYKGVLDNAGVLMPEYRPLAGYEDLVSNEDGLIADGLEQLPKGTYYLVEKSAPAGYELLDAPVVFRVHGAEGLALISAPENAGVDMVNDGAGHVSLEIRIVNTYAMDVPVTIPSLPMTGGWGFYPQIIAVVILSLMLCRVFWLRKRS